MGQKPIHQKKMCPRCHLPIAPRLAFQQFTVCAACGWLISRSESRYDAETENLCISVIATVAFALIMLFLYAKPKYVKTEFASSAPVESGDTRVSDDAQ